MTEPSKCPQAVDLRDLPAAQLLEFGGGTADPEKKQVDARCLLSFGQLPFAQEARSQEPGRSGLGVVHTQVPQLAVAAVPHL